eukprot:SAG31_NODE_326_length_17664_cov_10.038543_5_plen_160_part_00
MRGAHRSRACCAARTLIGCRCTSESIARKQKLRAEIPTSKRCATAPSFASALCSLRWWLWASWLCAWWQVLECLVKIWEWADDVRDDLLGLMRSQQERVRMPRTVPTGEPPAKYDLNHLGGLEFSTGQTSLRVLLPALLFAFCLCTLHFAVCASRFAAI